MRTLIAPATATVFLAMGLTSPGCGTTRNTTTSRTGTEQLVLTHSWDAAINQIDFRPLAGVPVYLETAAIDGLDKGYLISSIRQAMLESGAQLRAKPEEAAWVVEPRVGAYGTDDSQFLIGIPQMSVPALMPGIPGAAIPEMALLKKTRQKGVSKLALFAYERSSGRLTWTSGNSRASANSRDLFIGGVGPLHSGSIHKTPEFFGMQLPGTVEAPPPEGIHLTLPVEPIGPPAPGDVPLPPPLTPSPFLKP